jgi:hypothetical protein
MKLFLLAKSKAAPIVSVILLGCSGGSSSSPGAESPGAAPKSEAQPSNNTEPAGSTWEGSNSESEWTEAATPEEERRNKTFPSKRSMDDIIAVVKDNRHLFRLCYEKYQHEKPELQGDLVISFRITSRGRVIDAQVNPEGTTLTDENVGSCAANEMKKLTFPEVASGRDTEVNYPFNFKPRGAK